MGYQSLEVIGGSQGGLSKAAPEFPRDALNFRAEWQPDPWVHLSMLIAL